MRRLGFRVQAFLTVRRLVSRFASADALKWPGSARGVPLGRKMTVSGAQNRASGALEYASASLTERTREYLSPILEAP